MYAGRYNLGSAAYQHIWCVFWASFIFWYFRISYFCVPMIFTFYTRIIPQEQHKNPSTAATRKSQGLVKDYSLLLTKPYLMGVFAIATFMNLSVQFLISKRECSLVLIILQSLMAAQLLPGLKDLKVQLSALYHCYLQCLARAFLCVNSG